MKIEFHGVPKSYDSITAGSVFISSFGKEKAYFLKVLFEQHHHIVGLSVVDRDHSNKPRLYEQDLLINDIVLELPNTVLVPSRKFEHFDSRKQH